MLEQVLEHGVALVAAQLRDGEVHIRVTSRDRRPASGLDPAHFDTDGAGDGPDVGPPGGTIGDGP